jgi:hypothetical protein
MVDMRRALQRDLGWNPDFKFLFLVDAERRRYKNWGVTNWDLRRWGNRQGTERKRDLRGLKGGHKVRDV